MIELIELIELEMKIGLRAKLRVETEITEQETELEIETKLQGFFGRPSSGSYSERSGACFSGRSSRRRCSLPGP